MRPTWAIAALGLLLAACGGTAEPDRFSLRTPGANTGEGPLPATGTPAPAPAPRTAPGPEAKAVTGVERRVIKGWSDSLRGGHVSDAARYFTVPALVSNDSASFIKLGSAAEIEAFNRGLPCGAKLIRVRRGVADFVVGVFRLTERKGAGAGCGAGVGGTAAVAFLIRDGHIQQWVRADDAGAAPAPAPGATSTPTPEPTTSAPQTIG